MAIDSGVIQEVIGAILGVPGITALLSRNVKGQYCVRPGNFEPIDALFPQITVNYEEGKSEAKFPAEFGHLHIIVWADEKQKQPLKLLENIKDQILLLFNRQGEVHNNIDVPSNTGIRFNEFLKTSNETDFDTVIKKYFYHITFRICVSDKSESFAPSDAGDKSWV